MSDVSSAAKVDLRWLYDFKNGRFRDPGVTKVQRVYNVVIANLKKQGASHGEPHGTEATHDDSLARPASESVKSECCEPAAVHEPAAGTGGHAVLGQQEGGL